MKINDLFFEKNILPDYEKNFDSFFSVPEWAVKEEARENGTPAFLFSEVTGYAIQDLILLFELTGKQDYIKHAVASANWLCDKAHDSSGGILTRNYGAKIELEALKQTPNPDWLQYSFLEKKIFTFDTGIVLKGVCDLIKFFNKHREIVGNQIAMTNKFLNSAKRMGDFLINLMEKNDSVLPAIFDAKNNKILISIDSCWSRRSGAFHAKIAEGLISLYELTNNQTYETGAITLCGSAISNANQTPNGAFITSLDSHGKYTELHPHCYATEGLLSAGIFLENPSFIEYALKATRWALDHENNNGKISQKINVNTGEAKAGSRTDSLAQVLSLGADSAIYPLLNKKEREALDRIAKKILKVKNQYGYFEYGEYDKPFNGKNKAKTKSYWTNMFCLKGLQRYFKIEK